LFISVAYSSDSCELTEEYKAARREAYKTAHTSYKACLKSTTDAAYWRDYTECIKQNGKNTGTYCMHVNQRNKMNPDEIKHCKILDPTTEELIEYFHEVVSEKDITKCVASLYGRSKILPFNFRT